MKNNKISKITMLASLLVAGIVNAQEFYTCVPKKDWWKNTIKESVKEQKEEEWFLFYERVIGLDKSYIITGELDIGEYIIELVEFSEVKGGKDGPVIARNKIELKKKGKIRYFISNSYGCLEHKLKENLEGFDFKQAVFITKSDNLPMSCKDSIILLYIDDLVLFASKSNGSASIDFERKKLNIYKKD